MQKRGYIRLKTKVSIHEKLSAGFWWVNERGQERWASIKYEQLSDFCYGCGCLGNTSQVCQSKIVCSEKDVRRPMYGPWLLCVCQRQQSGWSTIGGGSKLIPPKRDTTRHTWQDMMREGSVGSTHQDNHIRDLKLEVVEDRSTQVMGPASAT